jgi:hypothetical protein
MISVKRLAGTPSSFARARRQAERRQIFLAQDFAGMGLQPGH